MSKSMFAKRHYEAIAEVIQDIRGRHLNAGLALTCAMANMLQSDNPRFDRARFEAACVPGANVKQRGAKLAKAVFANELRGIPRLDKAPDKVDWYQPKTGQACSCKRGVERDNCPACEGTGWRIDFAAIRTR